jgi:hypothetical protein
MFRCFHGVPSSLGGRNAGTNTVVTILIDEYKPRWTFLHIEGKSQDDIKSAITEKIRNSTHNFLNTSK